MSILLDETACELFKVHSSVTAYKMLELKKLVFAPIRVMNSFKVMTEFVELLDAMVSLLPYIIRQSSTVEDDIKTLQKL